MITGDNLDTKIWPYALYHAIRLYNSFPEPNKIIYPIYIYTSKRENLSSLRKFVCRVYVLPTGKRKPKLKNHVSKGIFLGYYPHTTQNVLYYDVDTHRIKLDSHVFIW